MRKTSLPPSATSQAARPARNWHPRKAAKAVIDAAYTLGAEDPPASSLRAAVEVLWAEANKQSPETDTKKLLGEVSDFVEELYTRQKGQGHGKQARRLATIRARKIVKDWGEENAPKTEDE